MAEIRRYAAEGRVSPGSTLERPDGTAVTLAQAGVSVPPPMAASPAPAPPRRGGSGCTTCGIIAAVSLAVLVPLMAILAAILFPVFARAREKARQTTCLANLSRVSMSLLLYAQANGDRLPNAATWRQDIAPYVQNSQIMECPSSRKGQSSYAFNEKLSKKKVSTIKDPANTILVYDADLASHAGPHLGGGNVGYADGHVKWLSNGSFALGATGP